MTTHPSGLDYDRWMLLVDAHVVRMIGVHVLDLPDFQFRDAYDDEQEAIDVATEIVERTERGDF